MKFENAKPVRLLLKIYHLVWFNSAERDISFEPSVSNQKLSHI